MNKNPQEQQSNIADTTLAVTSDNHSYSSSRAGERWLSALSIGIVVIYALFFIVFSQHSGPRDHDQFLVFHELQYWNSQLFGMAKQWSPLMCSGLSLAGEPQVPFMSLSMMLTYVLGPLWGLKLATLLYFIAGWFGAYLYAGLWLKAFSSRALAAALFIGNGFFFCRLAYGHIDFIPFLSLPLMLWTLHYSVLMASNVSWRSVLHSLIVTLLMAAGIAVVIDGSPVAIIHLMFWVGLYALVLSRTARSWAPVVMLSSAVMIAILLDAGYLWPMLETQSMFPRRTPDRFTSFLSLIWFELLPVRGKLLPANGKGHELTVFIGPVLTYLIWRYRHWLSTALPPVMKHPLVIVSVVSIVLGMGSLKPLHIPTWLSPFDMLRPLPGFRSLNVTGRYWGFLALPLSLFAATALSRAVIDFKGQRRWHLWLGFAVLLQLGFQTQTLLSKWLHSQPFQHQDFNQTFKQGPESIGHVVIGRKYQGEFITPTRGVVDCYDEDDFIKANMDPGTQLIKQQLYNEATIPVRPSIHSGFITWSHIRLWMDQGAVESTVTQPINNASLKLILNQAFHPLWQADGCQISRGDGNNLILDCPMSRWQAGPVNLKFNDELSFLAADISIKAWQLWLPAISMLILLSYFVRRRSTDPTQP